MEYSLCLMPIIHEIKTHCVNYKPSNICIGLLQNPLTKVQKSDNDPCWGQESVMHININDFQTGFPNQNKDL